MGISKATFRCDNCGLETTVRFPTRDGRSKPRGWAIIVFEYLAVYACSVECQKEWESSHGVGRIPVSIPQEEDVSVFIKALLSGRLEKIDIPFRREKDLSTKMAEEFKVPKEIVSEFFDHITKTTCPKCKAEPEERCHLTDGDESVTCPEHGQELKPIVHSERVEAARITWRGKLQ